MLLESCSAAKMMAETTSSSRLVGSCKRARHKHDIARTAATCTFVERSCPQDETYIRTLSFMRRSIVDCISSKSSSLSSVPSVILLKITPMIWQTYRDIRWYRDAFAQHVKIYAKSNGLVLGAVKSEQLLNDNKRHFPVQSRVGSRLNSKPANELHDALYGSTSFEDQ